MAETPAYLLAALDRMTTARPVRPESFARSGEARAEVRHVREVREVIEDENIVAVGISEKITDDKHTGVLCLCFYVARKLSKARVRAGRLVPPVIAAPDGHAAYTDVKAIGVVRPEAKRQRSPVQSGFSVGHPNVGAGTVGAIVRKGKQLCILSNAHVLAESGRAKLHDDIIFPAVLDRGHLPKHLVGQLKQFIRFKAGGEFVNRVDAALCAIASGREDLDFSICGMQGAPKIGRARRGMRIIKCGRTTGVTEGTVEDVNFRVVVNYRGVGPVGFLDQVLCTRYSKAGDSGAIVVDKDSGRIVGLHFAGAPGGSVFNPIRQVIDALGIRFVRS